MAISNRQLSIQKANLLREVTSKVSASSKRDLDAQAIQTLDGATDVGTVLDYVAAERLRCMPHSGSRYDKVLRWAEMFSVHVAAFALNVSEVVTHSHEAAEQIWGSTLLLLQLGESHLDLLEKLFSVFYKLGLSLEIFSHTHELLLENAQAQQSCSQAFASLLQVTANSSFYYYKKSTHAVISLKSGEFERQFGRTIESYYVSRTAVSVQTWSQSVQTLLSDKQYFDVGTVRRFLAPQDTVVQALMSGRVSSRHRRAEFTCEWASKRLSDFARGKNSLMLLTGKEYSGKSVLAGWMAERLTNTTGRLGHKVIFYDIDASLKDLGTPLAVVQGLVLQVFEQSIGDQTLYKDVCAALRADADGRDAGQIAELLWVALDRALSKMEKTMIIVDGVDVLQEKQQYELLQKLSDVSLKNTNVKAVAVSRPLAKAPPKDAKVWTVEVDDTKEDIASFAYERLLSFPSLKTLPRSQISSVAERVSTAASGSFAWADVAIEILAVEKTIAGVTKTLDGLPKSLRDLMNRLVTTVNLTERDTRAIFAWMLAAQRPLLIDEVKCLLEVDASGLQVNERFTDIEDDVKRACGGLVAVTDGILRFRSLAIRHHLVDLSANVKDFSNSNKNAFPFHIQEASYDLCLRTLAYTKLVLDRQYPVSTTFLTQTQLLEVFEENVFMEYSSRYWLTHFRNSPMHQFPGAHKLTGTFKSVFPASIAHSLIEGTCVQAQYNLRDSYDLLQLSLTLRKTVLGEESEAVLQTLVNVALIRRKLHLKETNVFFFQAFRLARKLLGTDNDATLIVARNYIDSVIVFEKSTETEETLTYIVTMQKKQSGVSHKTTITYMRRLAEYYVKINEKTRASQLYREIYEVLVSRYGYHHAETEEIYKSLKATSTKEEVETITQNHQKSTERTIEVSDERRVTSTRDMIKRYEEEKNTKKAEELMVDYWREISEKSRTSRDVKVQEQQVDATFQYVEFLHRHKRDEEATNILNGLYLELEKSTNYNESKVSWIQRIGNELKTMNAASSARGVFSYLWSYYRSTGQQNTKEAQNVARSMIETSTPSADSPTTTSTQIDTLKEILESTSLTSQSVDITTIKTAQQLIVIYLRQDRHEEIIQVCKDILHRHWPAVITNRKDISIPSTFPKESIDIARQLTKSYSRLNYTDEASQVLYQIFIAYRRQPKEHIEQLTTFAKELITHYETVYRHGDALQVYQALYEVLVEVYGAANSKTIETLYSKADFELRLNRRSAAQSSYNLIYTTLKDKSDLCHKDGIRAALALCKLYEREQKWDAARSTYHVLWQTFLQKGQEYSLGVEFVDQIFNRYLYILENKTQTDYKTVRSLAAEYRQTCIKFYGAESERTITASMKFAELDEKDEQHKDEALSIYEFILNAHKNSKISTASTFALIAAARRRVAHLYSGKSVTSDRAQNLYIEEFESTRSKNGVSHADTLSWLNLLVSCYRKRNTTETNRDAANKLQEVSSYIILNETDTQRLYESSQTIAKIYKTNEVTNPSATEFVAELRRHAVTGQSNIVALKNTTLTRRSYTFIVGLEEGLSGGQFSTLMSELITESLLTEAFLKARKTNASFDTTFSYGNRLRVFLKSKNRKEYTRIESELFEVFEQKIMGKREVEKSASRQFFDIVLNEVDKDSHDLAVLQIVSDAITRAFNENQFQRGYSLAVIADAYLHHYDGFKSQRKIEIAFKICLLLSGRGTRKTADSKLEQQLEHFAGVLLAEVLQAAKEIQLNLVALPLPELNILVGILGQQKKYQDLEWILNDLWTARHSQPSWPATTVVAIGRRLVECRFSMGDRASALDLLEDICYNLRRVWGPLDKSTLEMESLRAQMYTTLGQHGRVMGVHEDILAHLTSDELEMDQVTSAEEGSIAVKHVTELRTAFFRNGAKWPRDKDEHVYDELFHVVQEQVGGEKAWKEAKVEDVNKWSSSSKSFKDDGSGVWKGVVNGQWEFMAGDSKTKHINALRRRSARYSSGYSNGSNGTNGATGTDGTDGTNGVSTKLLPVAERRVETVAVNGK